MTNTVRGLDGHYYTDPAVFAAELERIFARTWLMVGHQSQVAEPGQLFTAQVGDESIIVANDNGTVRAYYNVCRHRGHQLVPDPTYHDAAAVPFEQPGGQAAPVTSITCPYHAWTYDLGGRLVHARGEKVGPLCVPEVRVDTMAGFLFANLDADAPSLADTVPGIEDEILAIASEAPKRIFTYRRSHVIKANWKLAVENYNECYHCPNVHKAFTSGVVSPTSYRIQPRDNAIHHWAQPQPSGKARYRLSDESSAYGSFYIWPLSSIQCYPGQVINTFRWVPLAVDRTLLLREWWFDWPEPTPEQMEIIELDWSTTVTEDFDLMASVQRGVASRGYRAGPLIVNPSGVADIHSENTVPHLHGLVKSALGHDKP